MEVSPLFVLFLGMGTVFFGLICLIFITKLMSLVVRKTEKPPVKSPVSGTSAVAAAPVAAGIAFPDRKLLDAVIAAAIAAYDGTQLQGLRIHAIRQIGGQGGAKGPFVAAVSAAVATTMGADVQGLRIHSIKKI